MENLTFANLAIGDTFDFIDPNSLRNSYFARCVKTSIRKYAELENRSKTYTVGTVNARVFHVTRTAS